MLTLHSTAAAATPTNSISSAGASIISLLSMGSTINQRRIASARRSKYNILSAECNTTATNLSVERAAK